MPKKALVLFDGVCNLCNAAIDVILRHDPEGHFLFASLQSPVGEAWRKRCGIQEETIVLVEQGRCYTASTAVLRIARHLHGLIKALYMLVLLPRPLRDALYRWVARNRYAWFGRRSTCRVPSPEEAARFLG